MSEGGVSPFWRRRGVAVAVAISLTVMIVGSVAQPSGAAPIFSDVPDDHPFHDDIEWMVDRGITMGFDDGTFRPRDPVTRQGMAAFLYRLAGSPPGPFDDPGFTDVDDTDPFFDEIAWLSYSEITSGHPDGTFRPLEPVTRQGMAAFLARLAGGPPPVYPDPGYSDVDDLHPFFDEIAWMAAAGVTTGYDDGTFRPHSVVTRQAMSAFLHRLKESTPIVTPLADGLQAPWDVAFVPDGTAYFTERDTGVLKSLDPSGHVEVVQTFDIDDGWETGLLGLEASPDVATDGLLYAYVSTDVDNRVVAFEPGQPETPIFTGIPIFNIHDGGRIDFGPDGNLWVTTGDVGNGANAQNPNSLAGKVLRLTPDGDPAPGNPGGALRDEIWSMGHRNVQGIAWHPSGKVFASELGPDVNDEVNVLVSGGNYGWPTVSGVANMPPYLNPVIVRQPATLSPSGAAVVPPGPNNAWAGDLLVAGLRGRRILRADLNASGNVISATPKFVGWFGRIRHVEAAPDGSMWLLTTNSESAGGPVVPVDRILRLIPPG